MAYGSSRGHLLQWQASVRRERVISVRFLIVAAILLTAMVVVLLVLVATDTALSVWRQLAEAPAWLRLGYVILLGGTTLTATWLAWRWLRPRNRAARKAGPVTVSESTLRADLAASHQAGIDTEQVLRELREQRRRKDSGEVFIAVYGEVSAGKSSLVRALLPGAEAASDARAGTTTRVRHYQWRSERGDRVVLADLPGFNLGDDREILDEARRSHLVVFLCDGDLTRSQFEELSRLRELRKPVVVALNKSDRFDSAELSAIRGRIAERSDIPGADIVGITAGGREELVRMLADGSEQAETRDRSADVEALRALLQAHLDRDLDLMESLRDSAVLLLAAEKLHDARRHHLQSQAEELVRKYARRAVVGALAAVAPGSDLVIQGVLATRLIQELCSLYGVSVKEVEIESFLKMAGGKLRKMSALTMAIAGNALKAFPGLGTISGGLLHAVAYGLIFDSLGRAAAETLASRGEFRPIPAAEAFEEHLSENLATGADRFAQLAFSQRREIPPS